MPILWNVSKTATLETKFDGRVFSFKPDERKKIFHPDEVNHIVFKLADKGLVLVPDEPTPTEKQLKELYLAGLKRRKKMLKDVIVQYQSANEERKAAKMGSVEPNEHEVACVREIKMIEKEITETSAVSKAESDMVKDYMRQEGIGAHEVESVTRKIKTDRAGDHSLEGGDTETDDDQEEAQEAQTAPKRKGRPPRVNAA